MLFNNSSGNPSIFRSRAIYRAWATGAVSRILDAINRALRREETFPNSFVKEHDRPLRKETFLDLFVKFIVYIKERLQVNFSACLVTSGRNGWMTMVICCTLPGNVHWGVNAHIANAGLLLE